MMYVVLDLKNMRFLFAHQSLPVVTNLAWLQCPNLQYSVYNTGAKGFLHDVNDFEMKTLYQNTTGQLASGWLGASMRGVLAELANRLPQADVVVFELDRQTHWADEQNNARGEQNKRCEAYTYQRGAFVPLKGEPTLSALQASKGSDEPAAALYGRGYYREAALRSAPGVALPPQARPGTTTAPRAAAPHSPASAPPAAPRTGGIKEIIWKVADQMWESAGRPTGTQEVLALRRKIMDELEKQDVKRTTSSNELGKWAANRTFG